MLINLANGFRACAVALASTSFFAITTSVNTLPLTKSITAHFIFLLLTTNIYCLKVSSGGTATQPSYVWTASLRLANIPLIVATANPVCSLIPLKLSPSSLNLTTNFSFLSLVFGLPPRLPELARR